PRTKECKVENQVSRPFNHMVQVEHMMVDDPFHKVEKSPPGEHPSQQYAAGWDSAGAAKCFPKKQQPGDGHDPTEQMEDTIPKHVDFQVHRQGLRIDAAHRILRGKHIVELQELMENDPIDKT